MSDSESATDLVALVTTKVLAAIAAEEGGDVAGALQYMEQCQMLVAVIPDFVLEKESASWDREAIDKAASRLRRRVNMTAGVIQNPIRFTRG